MPQVAPALAGWASPVGALPGFENKWLRVYVRSQKNDQEAKGQFILISRANMELLMPLSSVV